MPQVGGFLLGAFGAGAGAATAIGAVGAFKLGAAFAATTFGGLAVKLLTSVALSALSVALQPKTTQPGIRTTQTMTGGTNPEGFVLGFYATEGQFMAPMMSHGSAGKTPNAFLNYVIELGGIPGQSLAGLMIEGEYVEILTASPHAEYGQRIGGRFDGKAWIKFYDGTQTAADPMLMAKYPAGSIRPWTSDMVASGICYAILTFKYDRETFQGYPSVRFVLGGIPLYDPRKDGSAGGSGTQRWSDRSTWTQSDNPVVMVYNILRGIEIPGGHIWGGEATAEDLPRAMWVAAMNACDALVGNGDGGTEKAYRAGFEVMVEDEPFSVIEELAKAASALVWEEGGFWGIRVGAPALPVAFLTDDDIIITEPQEYDPFPAPDQLYNGIAASHPDPESLWDAADAPPRFNEGWEAEDGGRRLVADLSLPAVPHAVQVQRLMSSMIKSHRRTRIHVLTLPPDFGALSPCDTISWTSARNGYSTKLFEIHETARDPRVGLIRVKMREVDPEDYNVPSDLALPSPVDRRRVVPEPQAVPGFAVVAHTIVDANGYDRRAGVLIVWDEDAANDARGIRFACRIKGDTDSGIQTALYDVALGQAIEERLPATTYEYRARFVVDRPTEWSDWEEVTTHNVRFGLGDLDAEISDAISSAVSNATDALEAAEAARDAIQEAIDDVDSTVEGAIEAYDAGVAGGLTATVTSQMSAIASLNGYTAAVAMLTAELSNGKITGIRATVHDGAGGASSGSLLELLGDQVIAPGSITTSSLYLVDIREYWPSSDWSDPNWWIRHFDDVEDIDGAPGDPVAKIKRLTAGDGVLRQDIATYDYLAVSEGEEYVVEFWARQTGTIDTALCRPHYRWTAGAPIGPEYNAGTFYYDEELYLTNTWQKYTTTLVVGPGQDYARFGIRFYNTTGMTEVGGLKLRKKNGAELVLDGTLLGNHIKSKSITVDHMNVNFLRGERITASYLDIDTLLQILPDAALAYGKTAISDTAPGIFFGRDTGTSGSQFGFSASTSVGGREQSIIMSETGGLSLKNAQFRRAAAGGWIDTIRDTNLSKQALPAGMQTLTIQASGGGGGGMGVIGGYKTASYSSGGNGGTTTVKLYDGNTLKQTITATGGKGAGQSGHTYTGTNGQANAINGSTGGGISGAGVAGGGGGGGYRQILTVEGGEGNDHYTNFYGRGGMAGQRKVVSNIDVSTWANPQIEIVIGAGGAAPSTPTSGSGRGGAGGKGRVIYSYNTISEFAANVVTMAPTATGTISKSGTSITFPNLGPGFWVLSDSGTSPLDIGLVEVDNSGTTVQIYTVSTASFFAAKRPVRISGGYSANRTIKYAFHSMGEL